jgi:hypothetical protein
MVQKTEKHFKDSVILSNKTIFVDKIQVNVHAHTPTTADFFIQTTNFDIMVECKETKLENKFQISRLKQETKLLEFQNRFKRNKSFILLSFFDGSITKSDCFMIPISKWLHARRLYGFKSVSYGDCLNYFYECKVTNNSQKHWRINFADNNF